MVADKKCATVVCTTEEKPKKLPPDGGWGWWVVFGYIITGVTCIPIIQNFGLIYKGRLQDLGLTSTDITTIVSMNSAIGQILGVFQSPLLKRFGYRTMAIFGVAAFTLGTVLTGYSYSFTAFMITYGIITSIGFTYTLTSFSIAINSYFKKNRSRASGLLMGFTGLGPVVMPQLVSYSLVYYGTLGTALILAGLNAHGFIGACLLRPVAQYMKYPPKVDTNEEVEGQPKEMETRTRSVHDDTESMCLVDVESLTEFNPNRRRSSSSLGKRVRSVSECSGSSGEKKYYKEVNAAALETLSEEEHPLQSHQSTDDHLYNEDEVFNSMKSTIDLANKLTFASMETLSDCINPYIEEIPRSRRPESESTISADTVNQKPSKWRAIGTWFNKQFDFDLLKDTTFLLIMTGMSVAIIGELMFSILTPFILYEIGMDLQTTATFMSIIAIADIIARFISPYIAECVKIRNPRVMYSISLIALLLTRASLLFVTGAIGLKFVAVAIGFAKGVRSVFWGLVMPHHVPMEKLGSAMSFQNLVNGILIFFAGPLSGLIVEINNSYTNIIYVSNVMTAITVLLWTLEYLVMRFCSSKKQPKL